jgi:hypothetical protein
VSAFHAAAIMKMSSGVLKISQASLRFFTHLAARRALNSAL